MQTITVFCGAKEGASPTYKEVSQQLGAYIAKQNIHLIYGGGSIGLMGALADAALDSGGKVTGIIPHFMKDKEALHPDLSNVVWTEGLFERKKKMIELADAFIVLPGGIGTLDELLEVWTSAQLGVHRKPIGVLNFDGFYSAFLQFIQHLTNEAFLPVKDVNDLLIVKDNVRDLVKALAR